jgi:hypothetical protein
MGFQDPLVATITALVCERFETVPDGEGISDLEVAAAERELNAPLPASYRVFLCYFGTDPSALRNLFGLPRHRTWGDIVLMNSLFGPVDSSGYVQFAVEDGQAFYFDTARMDERGECPVVIRVGRQALVVAEDFIDFLTRCEVGKIG